MENSRENEKHVNKMIYNLIWFANEDNLHQINIYESSYLSENNLV